MNTSLLSEARRLFRSAYDAQLAGRIEEAIALYRRSLDAMPTPEAHTFLGWSYSIQEHYDDAIEECRKAIALDPDYGNPYNDIGAYMISLGKLEESITWLEQACVASRYDARHYPHYNLGRVMERLGDFMRARDEYRSAVQCEPAYTAASLALERLEAWMN